MSDLYYRKFSEKRSGHERYTLLPESIRDGNAAGITDVFEVDQLDFMRLAAEAYGHTLEEKEPGAPSL